MSTVEFWGGLGVIGSSKVLVRSGDHRVLLDIGLDIPAGGDLFRAPVTERPGRQLSDRLRVGAAPRLGGLFAPEFLPDGDELATSDGDTAVFVSHPHIDHVGLAGFVRPDVPLHAHTDAVALLAALAEAGTGLAGREPSWVELCAGDESVSIAAERGAERAQSRRRIPTGQVVRHGDIEVECVPVDHDVPGASGYLVRTPDGTLAYTGDIRFHGRHPERSWSFVDRAAGCDVLVTEGTTLGWPAPDGPPRGPDQVAEAFAGALADTPGLVLLALYPRDVERAREFTALAASAGRTLVWPGPVAAMLRRVGLPDAVSADAATMDAVRAEPHRFVVQPEPYDLPALLDLPLGPGHPETVFVHANGEPLGAFDPRWSLFTDWLAALDVPLRMIGCSGHASQDDLHAMLERVRPGVVFPIHTTEPTRLHPPAGTRRVVARYGARYSFDGTEY